MDMKRFFLYFIVIAALALAGCGGNGGGTPSNGNGNGGMPPPPPPPMPMAIDLSGLLMGFGLTADDAGTHMIAAGANMDVGNANFACPAGGAACTVTVAADGTATSTGGQATASPSSAAQMAYEAKQEEDRKAALAMGMGIAMALQTPTDAAAGNGMPVGVAITRATTGDAKIALTVTDTDADTDTAPDAFADADDITRSAPPAIAGWMGETQMRSDDDASDMVTVYTDINNAKPQKLEYAAGAIPDPTAAGTLIVLEDQEAAYSSADDTEIKGTINGIAGTFTCDTSCTGITTVGDGNELPGQDPNTLTAALSSGWSFESDENVESQATQDNDYLYFGYWLQDAGDNKFAFNTFFGGNTGFAFTDALFTDTVSGDPDTGSSTFTAVESRAVYTGSAAGKYVEKTLAVVGGEATPVAIAGNYFTADARLTAYFGLSPNVALNMQNTIRGTISNFKNSNGDDVNFVITLNPIDFGESTNQGSDQTGRPGHFIGGTVAGVHGTGNDLTQSTGGEWEGQFFGAVGTAANNNEGTLKPTGVAGDFQAHFNDAHVVGAFGAKR